MSVLSIYLIVSFCSALLCFGAMALENRYNHLLDNGLWKFFSYSLVILGLPWLLMYRCIWAFKTVLDFIK